MFSAQEILILRKENARLQIQNYACRKAQLDWKNKAEKIEKDYQELKQKNKKLEDELKKAKEELEKIKKQRDTYKGMIFKPKAVQKDQEQDGVKRKPGGQIGHPGYSRKLPQRVDQSFRVFLKVCPHCNTPVKRSGSVDTHVVEDIPDFKEVKTTVTEYRMERQWCTNCHKEVVGKPASVIPFSRLGLNLIIQLLIFKYVCRMSLEIMVATLFQTYGLKIAEAGIVEVLKKTKSYFGKDYGNLLKAVRSSPTKHADETGWRIAGINGYLWAFLTKQEVYYTIEETRGGGVARKALADSRQEDMLVRDDYSGYKNLALRQQSCWAHLLRKSKEEVREKGCSKQMRALHQNLKQLYQQLEEEISKPFDTKRREEVYLYYSEYLTQVITTKFTAHDAKRIQTRLKNQGNNLLTALLYPDVPLTNNLAERQIRPAVVRKISGGSRSNTGAETFAINMSIIQTIKLRNQPLIPTLQTLILNGATGKN